MPDSYAVVQLRIQEALESIAPGTKPVITRLAAEFNVPYDQLLNRYNGIKPKDSHSYALTDHEEQALHQYIQRLDGLGMSCRRPMLVRAADSILRERPGPIRRVGNHWPTRFLKRNPQYHTRKQKPLAAQRKNAHKSEAILDWYQRFQSKCQEFGIQIEDVYNFDETGFRMGVGKSQWVITEEKTLPLYQTDADNREYITSIETIGASGYDLPAMLIVAGKQHLSNWFRESLNPDTLWGVSDTGYANDDLCEAYIKHFDRFTKNRRVGTWRMLLFDGYGSHLTREVLSFMETNNIIPFCLLPHSSHLCQPLDVGFF